MQRLPQAPQPKVLYAGDQRAYVFRGDCLELLWSLKIDARGFDVVFADPPYFLSNGGVTCRAGRRAPVDKGAWDRSAGVVDDHAWNLAWLSACRRVMSPDATIWVSGTQHSIFSVGYAMQQLGFRLLNQITWQKPNPPPNLGRRCFTHSTETLLWAARDTSSRYHFDYAAMRNRNGGRQMKCVWTVPPPSAAEKAHGRHPTQKPLALLELVLEASCPPGGVVLDPFCGSGTTGVAALTRGASFVGIEREDHYVELACRRLRADAHATTTPPRSAKSLLRMLGTVLASSAPIDGC